MTPPYSEKVIDLGFAEIITRHRLQIIHTHFTQDQTDPRNAISPETLSRLCNHGVDRVHPSRGYIGSIEAVPDILTLPEHMTDAQLEAERKQLLTENNAFTNENAVAKAINDERRIKAIGIKLQQIQARLNPVKEEIKRRNIARNADEQRAIIKAYRERFGIEVFEDILADVKSQLSEMADDMRRAG